MGVYLPNMEMPKNCFECPMVSGYEIADEVRTICSTVRCRLTNTKRPAGEAIASDCPLTPVPPHGDLIDRHEAYLRFGKLAETLEEKNDYLAGAPYAMAALFLNNVEEFPTIIPAEEGET